MLDGLLGRSNFKTKCKSALNRIKFRLEVIKKKRNAMQKFLKKDIADLLNNNLDRNAYGRAEGLYIELNLSSCYNYVEECCICITGHLKEMHKESECPEECKVAASSLIYAAARFADLPELRDLRNHFNEKYGKVLEPFLNKEFVEKLKSNPPTVEMKLQLMQEIAHEFNVTWDPKHLEQQLQSDSIPTQDQSTNSTSSNGASYDHNSFLRTSSDLVQAKGKHENGDHKHNNDGQRTRRHHSCSKFNDDLLLHEQHTTDQTPNEESGIRSKPFTNRIVPSPYITTKDEDESSLGKVKPIRPRSVRTKFSKQSSSISSTSEQDMDVNESPISRFQDDCEEEEEIMGKKKSPKTPLSARNMNLIPGNEILPKSELPLPPGRRRYLFPEGHQPCSPVLKEGEGQFRKSRFVEADHQHDVIMESAKSSIRHVKSESFLDEGAFGHVHPRMPDFDELAERVAALRKL